MDEAEFKRLLDLFPVVRSRNHRFADSESIRESTSSSAQKEVRSESVRGSTSSSAQNEVRSESVRGSTSSSAQNEINEWNNAWDKMDLNKDEAHHEDKFWQKLRSAGEKQVTKEEAERFCKAFQRIYKKLVYEEISLEAAWKFVDAVPSLRD